MSNIYDFCEYFYLLAKPLNKKEKRRIRNNLSPLSRHGPHVAQAARCVQKLYEAFQISMYTREGKGQQMREKEGDCENRGARNGSPKRRL